MGDKPAPSAESYMVLFLMISPDPCISSQGDVLILTELVFSSS